MCFESRKSKMRMKVKMKVKMKKVPQESKDNNSNSMAGVSWLEFGVRTWDMDEQAPGKLPVHST